VSEISIFYTKLLTIDNRTVMIPNGTLSNSSIVNASSMDKRRVDLYIGVSYHADLALTKRVLTSVVTADPCYLAEEPLNVFVSELADSSVQMGVRFWVKNEEYWDTRWRVTENIKLALDENHISIPFPQVEVTMGK
jgi:small conductance mechanosensitive channel